MSWKQSSAVSGGNSTAGDNMRVLNRSNNSSGTSSGADVHPELASRFANLDLGYGFY